MVGLAQDFARAFYGFVAQTLKIEQGLAAAQDSAWLQTLAARSSLPSPYDYAVSALNIIQMYALKTIVVVLSLPVYAVFLIWGMGEGLTVRALRRYRAAHETAYVFHHAKKLVWPMVALPVVVYLAWPAHISPVIVFGPCALVYGSGLGRDGRQVQEIPVRSHAMVNTPVPLAAAIVLLVSFGAPAHSRGRASIRSRARACRVGAHPSGARFYPADGARHPELC